MLVERSQGEIWARSSNVAQVRHCVIVKFSGILAQTQATTAVEIISQELQPVL